MICSLFFPSPMDPQHNNPVACVRFASHQFLTMGHFLCQGERVIPCSLLNLQRKAVQMCLAYLSGFPSPTTSPLVLPPNGIPAWQRGVQRLRESTCCFFQALGEGRWLQSGLSMCRFLFLKTKCGLWIQRIAHQAPWGQRSFLVGSLWLGRGLVGAAFRILICSEVSLGESY